LASDIVGEVAIIAGYDAKKSDVHGMAQRGGSVMSHIRLGEKVYSPLATKGEIDFLLAFEKLEAARWADFIKPGGIAVVNDQAIPPMAVTSGVTSYPADEVLLGLLNAGGRQAFLVRGSQIAVELDNPRVLNLAMLGYLARFLPFQPTEWDAAIAAHVPGRFLELNRRAFAAGAAAP
jgi:indolepyruvate ferredoxin oxidoreductase beta subunit